MKRLIVGLMLLLAATAEIALAQTLAMKYDSKGHPKAKGVWVTVRYPAGWEAREGERPNIVQKFSGNYSDLYTILALQILDAGGAVESECKSLSEKEAEKTFSDPEAKVFASNVKKITHEQKPAFMYDMESRIERAGMTTTLRHRVMTVCHKNTLISSWCSPSRYDKKRNEIMASVSELNAAGPLCFQFFNSLVLMSNY